MLVCVFMAPVEQNLQLKSGSQAYEYDGILS